MRLAILLICFAVFSAIGLPAMEVDKTKSGPSVKLPRQLQHDSSRVQVRRFKDEPIVGYSKEKEFIYDDVAPKSTSLWQRFWRWFWEKIELLFTKGTAGLWGKLIIACIVVGTITYLIMKFTGIDLKLLVGKSKKVAVPYQETLENIHEIDFAEQIEKALSQRNFRLAVRLLYLNTLKQLSDQSLINWQPEKTNQAYVNELGDHLFHQEFKDLTLQFEYIWYGEFIIDQTTFDPIYQSFLKFNREAR